MSVYVSIPSHDRKVTVETVRCLLNEQRTADSMGLNMTIAFAPGCSLITHARNHAVQDFLDSDSDQLIFIDSDVAWEPGDMLKLLTNSEELVGGAYRYKDENEGYPVGWMDKPELHADPVTGLLEVAMLPAGFLAIKRSVFTKLKEKFPERAYQFGGRVFQAYFHCPPGDGEDGAFCRDWREVGGKVWLEPRLTLTHVDSGRKYIGNIGNWLKSRIA
jgi:hypothetical protein